MLNLEQLKSAILKGNLLSQTCFHGLNLDAVFDGREDDNFDAAWMTSFRRMESMTVEGESKQQIDEIRELTFKVTYEYTESSDLSAYVSDDFELIAKALLLDISDPFVNALWLSYCQDQIPSGKLDLREGRIRELMGSAWQ